jgi:hypothetical protein
MHQSNQTFGGAIRAPLPALRKFFAHGVVQAHAHADCIAEAE